MAGNRLRIRVSPELGNGRMALAFSGWMNGGDVSTGTVEWFVGTFGAEKVAEIDPEGLYIYNFPGSMEVSSLFRPHTRIADGVIKDYHPPANAFFSDIDNNLLLFSGKEPHLNWHEFADCILSFASQTGVSSLFFIGSVAGTVPHTREPRLISAVSDGSLKSTLEPFVNSFADYEGPASFSTYLMTQASQHGLRMASLVAEIPAYIQGTNPKCIEAVVRKLAAVLGLQVNLDGLRAKSDAWLRRLDEALEDEHELAKHILRLEHDYDDEVFDTQMEDLKEWLQERGIRVD